MSKKYSLQMQFREYSLTSDSINMKSMYFSSSFINKSLYEGLQPLSALCIVHGYTVRMCKQFVLLYRNFLSTTICFAWEKSHIFSCMVSGRPYREYRGGGRNAPAVGSITPVLSLSHGTYISW